MASLLSIWFGCHLVLAVVFGAGGAGPKALWPGPTASIIMVPVIAFLFFIDLRIKRLDIFLANLGISRRTLLVGVVLLASGFEVLGNAIAGFLPTDPTP
jgi:hypothetical protein